MITKNNFLGADGLVWWMGVVESRKDPLNLGRCQVRIFGWHTDKLQLIPSADLPWAHPILPVNASNTNKTPHEGEYVIGLFFDGPSGQFPGYFGVIPGIPNVTPTPGTGFFDQRTSAELASSPSYLGASATLYPNRLGEPTTSRLYRNENTSSTVIGIETAALTKGVSTAGGGTWSQPTPSYNAKPPYNDVKETESGHVLEFDDTPKSERVHVAHKTGTYVEMRPDGSKVTKVVKDNYEITAGDNYVNIKGVCNITVNGNANIKVDGALNTEVGGDWNINVSGKVNGTAQSWNLTGQGSNAIVDGNGISVTGNYNLTGNYEQTGNMIVSGDITGGSIGIN